MKSRLSTSTLGKREPDFIFKCLFLNERNIKNKLFIIPMAKVMGQIMTELKSIREEIEYIKNNMPDKEMFLDMGEKQLLQDSYKHEKERKLISGKELKKKLRL